MSTHHSQRKIESPQKPNKMTLVVNRGSNDTDRNYFWNPFLFRFCFLWKISQWSWASIKTGVSFPQQDTAWLWSCVVCEILRSWSWWQNRKLLSWKTNAHISCADSFLFAFRRRQVGDFVRWTIELKIAITKLNPTQRQTCRIINHRSTIKSTVYRCCV